jgi:hypothetical protein
MTQSNRRPWFVHFYRDNPLKDGYLLINAPNRNKRIISKMPTAKYDPPLSANTIPPPTMTGTPQKTMIPIFLAMSITADLLALNAILNRVRQPWTKRPCALRSPAVFTALCAAFKISASLAESASKVKLKKHPQRPPLPPFIICYHYHF